MLLKYSLVFKISLVSGWGVLNVARKLIFYQGILQDICIFLLEAFQIVVCV